MFFASLIAASVFAVNNPQAADSVARLLPTLSHSIAAIETLPGDKPKPPGSAVAISVEETAPDTTTPKADNVVKAENAIAPELNSPEFIVSLEHPAGICEEILEPTVLEVTQEVADDSPLTTPELLPTVMAPPVATETEQNLDAAQEADAVVETTTPTKPSADAVSINDVNAETNTLSASPSDSEELAIKVAVPAELAESWPHLSDHTRATILMLIEADQMVKS